MQKRRNSSQSHTLRYYLTRLWRTWHLALCTKQPKAENFAIFDVILYPRVKAKPCKLHAHTFLQFDRSNSSKSGSSSSSSRNKFRLFLVLACFSLSLSIPPAKCLLSPLIVISPLYFNGLTGTLMHHQIREFKLGN